MSEHYVYAVFVEKKLKYIGKGKGNRFEHGVSGCSHVFGLNECYFQGKLIEVGIVRDGLSDESACSLEVDLIWGLGSAEDIALYNIRNGPSLITTYPNMTEEEFYNECRIIKSVKYIKGQYCIHPAYSDKNRGEESTWRRI